jgi:hypothetical protein
LSYATGDYFFAELASIKLAESGIKLWRDQGQLRAGDDWRHGIERGIGESLAVVVALSTKSAESSYVTYEWAYALGKGKVIIPTRLNHCPIHPKLEPIQYLDFSNHANLPWASLVERILEVEVDALSANKAAEEANSKGVKPVDPVAKAILAYLNQRGYQTASFDRIRKRVAPALTDDRLLKLIKDHPQAFRETRLVEGQAGLTELVP